jgi:hypothetical protein
MKLNNEQLGNLDKEIKFYSGWNILEGKICKENRMYGRCSSICTICMSNLLEDFYFDIYTSPLKIQDDNLSKSEAIMIFSAYTKI